MNKLLKILIISSFVILSMILILLLYSTISPRVDHPECYAGSGKWTYLPNSCVDRCDAGACYQAFTYGCDCGNSKCWNGTTCILNPILTASNVSDVANVNTSNVYDIININVTVDDNFDMSKSLTPYNSSELRSITQIGNKIISDIDDTIYDSLSHEVKTFFGEKYVKFGPKLDEIGGSPNSQEFLFSGVGCIADGACDRYFIRFNYENKTVKIIENAVGWTGVPTKYQKLALMIVERDEPEIIEKTDRNPDIRWMSEQYGNLTLLFVNHLGGIPESPHAWLIINLEQQKILSISKMWW